MKIIRRQEENDKYYLTIYFDDDEQHGVVFKNGKWMYYRNGVTVWRNPLGGWYFFNSHGEKVSGFPCRLAAAVAYRIMR